MTGNGRNLRLGACSWTAKGWEEVFYSPGCKKNDYLTEYARRFNAVEVDSTFYGLPKADTVKRWRESTPEDFVFAAKCPQVITHQKFMEDCDEERDAFLATLGLLEEKCGPLLFQFPYFAKARGVTLQQFLDKLGPFLEGLPREGYAFAVEVRNKTWIQPPLLNMLRAFNVALALIDHPWMAPPGQLFRGEVTTAPHVYIRWLGDRQGIEKLTKVWKEPVVAREDDLAAWAPPIKQLLERGVSVYGFVNNHFSGYAPADLATLQGLLA
jgi:uncharacterized protein YecE (DUF72 family)